MEKLRATLLTLLILVIALAATAYYGREAIQEYFQGREDLLDAQGRLALTEANARQIDAVTATMQRQNRVLVVVASIGVIQALAVTVGLVLVAVGARFERQPRRTVIFRYGELEDDSQVVVIDGRPYREADLVPLWADRTTESS